MADVIPTYTKTGNREGSTLNMTWETLTSTDTQGSAADVSMFDAITVQISGTAGTATGHLQGTINGTNWVVLSNPQGTAISGTSGLFKVQQNVWKIRPAVTGANGSTDMDFSIQAHKINPLRA